MVSFARDNGQLFYNSERKIDYANRHFTQIGGPHYSPYADAFVQGQGHACPVSGKTRKEKLSA